MDLNNKFRVQGNAEGTQIGHPPTILRTLTREDTFNLLCWLTAISGVTLAEIDDGVAQLRELDPSAAPARRTMPGPAPVVSRNGGIVSTASAVRSPRAPLWVAASQADIERDGVQERFELLSKSPIGSNLVEEHAGRTWRFQVAVDDDGRKTVRGFVHNSAAVAAGVGAPAAPHIAQQPQAGA